MAVRVEMVAISELVVYRVHLAPRKLSKSCQPLAWSDEELAALVLLAAVVVEAAVVALLAAVAAAAAVAASAVAVVRGSWKRPRTRGC
jgi:hypothetical protein